MILSFICYPFDSTHAHGCRFPLPTPGHR
jgi:hypothetical protein